MRVKIQPSKLSGIVQAPASKSAMQRAAALSLLANGRSVLRNPGVSNDDKAALEVIARLGAKLSYQQDGSIEIVSNGVQPLSDEIHCGESGLGIRMFTPLAALSNQALKITGSGSLTKRPMDFFDRIFPELGIRFRSNAGKLPLEVQGPLQPRNITVDGSLSSQFLTGLLFAFAASPMPVDTSIDVIGLKSKPYIALTLDLLSLAGKKILHSNYETFFFPASDDRIKPIDYTVEGDWSGAAFLLVAGLISGPLQVKGLQLNSSQADRAILEALRSAGPGFEEKNGVISVAPSDLRAFEFDATDCPDLFPPLAALASYCKGYTKIKGVSRLAHKESDRGATIQTEFGKMGVDIQLDGDFMTITGGEVLKGAGVSSHHDHRIAMATAVAALAANGETIIEDAEAIDKSYPDFYRHIQSLGGSLQLI